MKIETKVCADCGEEKIIHEFTKKYTVRCGQSIYCKLCTKKRRPLSEIEKLRQTVPHTLKTL